jgi:selenoprotein W-related protein
VRAVQELIPDYQHLIGDLRLVMGSKGVFDVSVDGEVVFSKHREGRHAERGEVRRRVEAMLGPDATVYGT